MNSFGNSLIWIILLGAAGYGVFVGFTSLQTQHGTATAVTTSPLVQNLTNQKNTIAAPVVTPIKQDQAIQPEPTVQDELLSSDDVARIKAVSQADFDRFIRRLDDLIKESVVIKKESMGKRMNEYKEIINLVLDKNISIAVEANDDLISSVNILKKSFGFAEDSLADKPLHEALKKLLLDARNS